MKKLAVLCVLALAAFGLVACGSSDDSTSSETTATETTESGGGGKEAKGGSAGSAAAVDFAAPSSGLEYTSDTATAKAGEVTINFENPQPLAHDVAIENDTGEVIGKTELVTEGSDSATVNLKPGKYTFYCTVPGHREAGMEGTLTVK
jgi:plastocyanin